MGRTTEERFWNKVEVFESTSTCWEWLGYKTRTGYGIFKVRTTGKQKSMSAHRYSLMLVSDSDNNNINLDACHKCDNRGCVNPHHLFWGTRKENMRDAINKGRFRLPPRVKGEQSSRTKLTNREVREIKSYIFAGGNQRAIGVMFGVSRDTIANIARRKSWNYIPWPNEQEGNY